MIASDSRPTRLMPLMAAAILLGGLIVVVSLLLAQDASPEPEVISVDGLVRDQALPVYLSDGAPAWVVSHTDGEMSLLTGFDAHAPGGMGQLLWWCPSSRSLSGPHTGSKYDEYGAKYDGPAPRGLAGWEVEVEGSRLTVGEAIPAPPVEAPYVGPPASGRRHCSGESSVLVHRFEGWPVWESPAALIDAAPSGWSRIDGVLEARPEGTVLCALDGCEESAPVEGVEIPSGEVQETIRPWPETQWIVRVDGDHLVGIARTVRPEDFVSGQTPG